MRRLLQLGAILFVFMAVISPVVECFDTWDPEGLDNDNELPLFLVVLLIVLCLVVAKMTAVCAMARQGAQTFVARVMTSLVLAGEGICTAAPIPQFSPPLRT